MLRDAINRKPVFPELPANRTYRRHGPNDANDPTETSAANFAVMHNRRRPRMVTRSRGACRAARATDSRSRLPVGVRALTELGFAAALQATSARSERS